MNTLCIFAWLLGRFSSVVFNCLKFSISQKWLITILISQNTKWQKLQKKCKRFNFDVQMSNLSIGEHFFYVIWLLLRRMPCCKFHTCDLCDLHEHKQGPRRQFESGWANTSEIFGRKWFITWVTFVIFFPEMYCLIMCPKFSSFRKGFATWVTFVIFVPFVNYVNVFL